MFCGHLQKLLSKSRYKKQTEYSTRILHQIQKNGQKIGDHVSKHERTDKLESLESPCQLSPPSFDCQLLITSKSQGSLKVTVTSAGPDKPGILMVTIMKLEFFFYHTKFSELTNSIICSNRLILTADFAY